MESDSDSTFTFNLFLSGFLFLHFKRSLIQLIFGEKKLIPKQGSFVLQSMLLFFPQLVVGPIVRATEFLPGLRNRGEHFKLKYINFARGISNFSWRD